MRLLLIALAALGVWSAGVATLGGSETTGAPEGLGTATPTLTPTATATATPTATPTARCTERTSTPTPTPSGYTFDITRMAVCNDSVLAVSGLYLTTDGTAASLYPVTENPPGCPSPTYTYSNPPAPLYYAIDIDWGTACVDPGEWVVLEFGTDCPAPACPAPAVYCQYWTLSGEPFASCGGTLPPTATPFLRELVWGDMDCFWPDGVTIGDAQIVARWLIGVFFIPEICVGGQVSLDGTLWTWGDVDCSGAVTIGDAQKIARSLVGLPVSQAEGCPRIGESVRVS